ncbi:hypothetical protein [Streptomyces sp. NPDC093589]|uniref:hypothetical protein n=1 Tax=Streptomyces sp. NPDC093589 TaxID=3366043 RepID=UPI0037F6CD04
MARVVSEQTMDVRVEFNHFCMQESDEDFVPVPYPDGEESPGRFLTVYEGRIDVASGGHTHVAVLTARVWDGEPAADSGDSWEAQGQAELFSETGELSFIVAGGPQLTTLDLGAAARRWAVRVRSAGRQEVALLAREGVAHGVERYLMDFWPVDE